MDEGMADSGGAIQAQQYSTLLLTNSSITANTARTRGGGMSAWASSVTMVGCLLTRNNVPSDSGVEGGAMHLQIAGDQTVEINGSSFTGNTAPSGGGIAVSQSSDITVRSSTLSNNTANNTAGGGMHLDYASTVQLTDVDLESNRAATQGGGVSVFGSSVLYMNASRATGNTGRQGGALSIQNSRADVGGTSFMSNTALTGGAGHLEYNPIASVFEDCDFESNVADSTDGDADCQGTEDCQGGALYFTRVSAPE